MICSQQETEQVHETEFGGSPSVKPKRVVHFSSGETLELEDSEDEEEGQSSIRNSFKRSTDKTRLSFRNVAILVGRASLLACDFLGERLAGALGLNAAKYQYAIDQHDSEHKSETSGHLPEEQREAVYLSPVLDWSRYGATGDMSRLSDSHQSLNEKHMEGKEGCHNRAFQAEEDS